MSVERRSDVGHLAAAAPSTHLGRDQHISLVAACQAGLLALHEDAVNAETHQCQHQQHGKHESSPVLRRPSALCAHEATDAAIVRRTNRAQRASVACEWWSGEVCVRAVQSAL